MILHTRRAFHLFIAILFIYSSIFIILTHQQENNNTGAGQQNDSNSNSEQQQPQQEGSPNSVEGQQTNSNSSEAQDPVSNTTLRHVADLPYTASPQLKPRKNDSLPPEDIAENIHDFSHKHHSQFTLKKNHSFVLVQIATTTHSPNHEGHNHHHESFHIEDAVDDILGDLNEEEDRNNVTTLAPENQESEKEKKDAEKIKPYIINGRVAEECEFPYIASFQKKVPGGGRHLCGGSLISRKHILTAAHCIDHNMPLIRGEWFKLQGYKIRLGLHDQAKYSKKHGASWVQSIDVAKVIIHPEEDLRRHVHDVAILELEKKVRENCCVHRIEMATRDIEDEALDKLHKGMISGWGTVETEGEGREPSQILMAAQTDIPKRKKCSESLEGYQLTNQNICGGYRKKETTCKGDSGGPLTVKSRKDDVEYLIGVTSFGGKVCGEIPAVYMSVAGYRDWILEVIGGDPGPAELPEELGCE